MNNKEYERIKAEAYINFCLFINFILIFLVSDFLYKTYLVMLGLMITGTITYGALIQMILKK